MAREIGTAALVVSAPAGLLAADVFLLAVKGVQEGFETLALRGDVAEAVVVVADRVGDEAGVASHVCSLGVFVAGVEGACSAQCLVDQAVEIVGAACRRHLESAHQVLGIGLSCWRGLRGLLGRKTQNIDPDPLDAHLEIGQACCLGAVVALAYKVVDLALMVVQEGLNVLLVEEAGALGAGQDQVQVQEEADPRVKGDPAEDKVEEVLDRGDYGEDDKVDEPGRDEGRV